MKSSNVLMSKRDQILISIFIMAYFFIVQITLLSPCPFKGYMHRITRPVEIFLGLDQSWCMFCPNPRDFNFHTYALVTFKDGSTGYYEFPRPDHMNQLKAALRERMRKHFYDIMPWDDFSVFRPSVARYVARCFANPKNPPTQVSLCYNGESIKPLSQGIIPSNTLPAGTGRKTYFVYQVSPEDLK
jgi:hypothetical protein